jgi:hypothetical protein
MNSTKTLFLFTLLATIPLLACSGLGDSGGVVPPPVNGNATLSITLQSKPLAPPPGTNLLSYSLTVGGLTLTSSTGAITNIAGPFTFDMLRLQSDSGLLTAAPVSVPAGTYSTLSVLFTAASVTYCTSTPGVAGCNTSTVKSVAGGGTNSVITFPNGGLVLTSSQQAGLSVYFNMGGTLTIANQVISAVNLAPTVVPVTTITLGSTHPSDLTSTQLDYLEDIIGSVSVSGNNVTIKTANHGSITAIADANTFYSPNCNLSGIGDGTNSINCVQANQVASIDGILNADGTMKLISYDPISAVSTTNNDWIEGVVAFAPTNSNQFTLVVSDSSNSTSGSLLPTPLAIGTPVTVNLDTVKGVPFGVDTNGLNVSPADVANFTSGSGSATSLLPGQMVAIHVETFTSANNVTTVKTDALELRYSRVAGIAAQNGTNTGFLYTSTTLPPYLNFTNAQALVEFTIGTPPAGNTTHFDGVTTSTNVTNGDTYSVRALFFGQNAGFPFVAGKVRQNQ